MTCKCSDHARGLGLLTEHAPSCEHFQHEIHALLQGLTSGIETWGKAEDGIPDDVWEAYAKAKHVIGERIVMLEGYKSLPDNEIINQTDVVMDYAGELFKIAETPLLRLAIGLKSSDVRCKWDGCRDIVRPLFSA